MKELTKRSRELRNNPTEPELKLWQVLRHAQLGSHKFRRQSAIDPFIVDFLCPAKALIVEVDGDTHDPDRDARRDAVLAAKGYRTLRFSNAEVMGNLVAVAETILAALAAQPDRWPHLNPSSEGEGLGGC